MLRNYIQQAIARINEEEKIQQLSAYIKKTDLRQIFPLDYINKTNPDINIENCHILVEEGGYIDESRKQITESVNEFYLGLRDRRNIYKTWLEMEEGQQNNGLLRDYIEQAIARINEEEKIQELSEHKKDLAYIQRILKIWD